MGESYFKQLQLQLIRRNLYFSLVCVSVFGLMLILLWQECQILFSTPVAVSKMADIRRLFENEPVYLHLEDANLYYTDWEVPKYGIGSDILFDKLKSNEFYAAVEYPDGYLLARIPQELVEDGVPAIENFSATVRLKPIYNAGDDYKAYCNLVQNLADIYQISYEEMEQFTPYSIALIETNGRRDAIGMIVLYLVGFAAGTFALIVFLWQRLDYRRGNLYRQLMKLGDAKKLLYAMDCSVDFGYAPYVNRSKFLQDIGLVTEQILIVMWNKKVRVLPAEMLLCVYMEDEPYRYGVFTIAKRPRLVLHFRDSNKPAYISSSGGLITLATVEAIGQKLGVLNGNGDALGALYRTDYRRFVAEAEQYKLEHAPISWI
jgi:hypothetical protein